MLVGIGSIRGLRQLYSAMSHPRFGLVLGRSIWQSRVDIYIGEKKAGIKLWRSLQRKYIIIEQVDLCVHPLEAVVL